MTSDQYKYNRASGYQPINGLELAELLSFADNRSMLSPVQGYYEQTWIQMKKDAIGAILTL